MPDLQPTLAAAAVATVERPRWDPKAGLLYFGTTIARKVATPKYSSHGSDVRLLLDVFEEDGWPPQIDSPFSDRDNGVLLHVTVRHLNYRLKGIYFRARGSQIVKWEVAHA